MPFTTGVGITWVNQRRRPVALKIKTTPAVVKPADTVSSMVNFLAIATAAIAFQMVRSRGGELRGEEKTHLHRLHGERDPKGYSCEYIP
jgi:hypothetical protein